jgi:hypothetical protein
MDVLNLWFWFPVLVISSFTASIAFRIRGTETERLVALWLWSPVWFLVLVEVKPATWQLFCGVAALVIAWIVSFVWTRAVLAKAQPANLRTGLVLWLVSLPQILVVASSFYQH